MRVDKTMAIPLWGAINRNEPQAKHPGKGVPEYLLLRTKDQPAPRSLGGAMFLDFFSKFVLIKNTKFLVLLF
jgi:hypothetical protein